MQEKEMWHPRRLDRRRTSRSKSALCGKSLSTANRVRATKVKRESRRTLRKLRGWKPRQIAVSYSHLPAGVCRTIEGTKRRGCPPLFLKLRVGFGSML